jgi:hypothetical protein
MSKRSSAKTLRVLAKAGFYNTTQVEPSGQNPGLDPQEIADIESMQIMDPSQLTLELVHRIGLFMGLNMSVIPPASLQKGMLVELEHGLRCSRTNVTDSKAIPTAKIALAHLEEFPDYYERLDRMEEEAERVFGRGGTRNIWLDGPSCPFFDTREPHE